MNHAVMVIGGGYGGSLVAKELDSEADVTLIDPREAFVNAAASLRALTRPDWAHNAFFSFATLLQQGRVIRDRAVSVDPKGVTLASGERVEADYLVLATGSGYTYPAKPHHASTSIDQQLDDLRETHRELAGTDRVLILGSQARSVWSSPERSRTSGRTSTWSSSTGPISCSPASFPRCGTSYAMRLDELGIDVRLSTGLTALPHGRGRSGRPLRGHYRQG